MSFAKLIHLAGLVSVFAGALIALAEILHPAGEDLACFLLYQAPQTARLSIRISNHRAS